MEYKYTLSYPCKIISSFYDNVFNKHKYELIKEITFRKRITLTDEEKDILLMFQFIQLVLTLPLESIKENLLTFYEFIFRKSSSENLRKIIRDFDISIEYVFISKYAPLFTTLDTYESFCLFILFTIDLSFKFEHQVVVPLDFCESIRTIEDSTVREYFLKLHLKSVIKPLEKDTLKSDFIKFVQKDKLKSYFSIIEELYLFGSVNKEDHHNSSDFDIVVKYKDTGDFASIKSFIQTFSKRVFTKFRRAVDLIPYDIFITLRDMSVAQRIV